MRAVLLNSLGLFVIILIGYLTKRLNLLIKADGTTISKIVVNVTLPAAIIVNLQSLEVKKSAIVTDCCRISIESCNDNHWSFFLKKARTSRTRIFDV